MAQAADMDHTALQQVYMLAVSRRDVQILSQVHTFKIIIMKRPDK